MAINITEGNHKWTELSYGKQRSIGCSNGNKYALRNMGNSKLENIHECKKYNKDQNAFYQEVAREIVDSGYKESGKLDFKNCEIHWKLSEDGRW